jgi:osmoprotectant transport system permease protein
MSRVAEFAAFIAAYRMELLERAVEHVGLTVFALAIAILVGLPVGIVLTRWKKAAGPAIGVIGIVQTVPSVALLGLLLPLLGIGVVPAIVALFLYALLPIVRNTFTGIEEVSAPVKEAARGMGMSDLQVLVKIELPLAMPVIFAGVRTATVINVGIATLCALIAAGGLGEFIFRGIALNNVQMMLAGALPAALMALFFDLVLAMIQKHIHRIGKTAIMAGMAVVAAGAAATAVHFFSNEGSFKAGFTAEFMERADGYPGLRDAYGLDFETVELDPGLMVLALREGKVDVIGGFSTDGRIQAYDFVILEDDRHYFPPYYAAPLLRSETLEKYPVLEDVFSRIAWKISNEAMTHMNYLVDHEKKTPLQVARAFLEDLGMDVSESRTGPADVVIGSKNFTEQYILARIFELLIESSSTLDAEVKPGLAGTKICFDALRAGEIDMYPEYTGTGLLVLLKADREILLSMKGDRDAVYRFVRDESKKRFHVEWMQPLGFNNTYALIMRAEDVREKAIRTISDLR